MTWTAPTLKLEVGLAAGPFDTSISWTDLTSRVRAFDMNRGRSDVLQQMQPGSITVELDNADGELFADQPGTLVCTAEGKGLPWCPVRATITWDGASWPLFYGYAGPEVWIPHRSARGVTATTTLQAFDAMSLFHRVPLPASPWQCLVDDLDPDYWVRGNADAAYLGNTATVPDWAVPSGAPTNTRTKVFTTGGGYIYVTAGMVPDDPTSSLTLPAGSRISVDRRDVFGGTGLTMISHYTVATVWRGNPFTGGDYNAIRVNSDQQGAGDDRWRVELQTTGQLVFILYDNTGAAFTFDAAPSNTMDGSAGRWDDDKNHLLVVRIDQASNAAVLWVDGHRVDISHASIGSMTYTGYLLVGTVSGPSSGAPVTVQEVMVWRSALTTDQVLDLAHCFLGDGQPYDGDSFTDRIGRGLDWANPRGATPGWPWTAGVDDLNWHDDPGVDPPVWGIGSVEALPGDLAAFLDQLCTSFGGTWWIDREGYIRARTAAALTYSGNAAEYVTLKASLTDAVSPGGTPTPVRRRAVEWSGAQAGRVKNQMAITYGADYGTASRNPDAIVVVTSSDDDSINNYGLESATVTSIAKGDAFVLDLAEAYVTRWSDPPIEINDVVIDVDNDAAAHFVVKRLELERAVRVVDTPRQAAAAVRTFDANVQGERWSWRANKITVTLSMAAA